MAQCRQQAADHQASLLTTLLSASPPVSVKDDAPVCSQHSGPIGATFSSSFPPHHTHPRTLLVKYSSGCAQLWKTLSYQSYFHCKGWVPSSPPPPPPLPPSPNQGVPCPSLIVSPVAEVPSPPGQHINKPFFIRDSRDMTHLLPLTAIL